MRGRFQKTMLVVIAAFAIVASAAAWKYLSGREPADRLVLSGTVEADEIHIGSKVGGRVAAVLVKEGQAVKPGEPLVRLESYDLDSKRADAVAAIQQAEANLQKMLHLSRPEEVAEARAQAEAARASVELARNGPRRQEIEASRAELQAAEADYESPD